MMLLLGLEAYKCCHELTAGYLQDNAAAAEQPNPAGGKLQE